MAGAFHEPLREFGMPVSAHDNHVGLNTLRHFSQPRSVSSAQKYQRDGGPGMMALLERLKESDRPALAENCP